MTVLTPIASWTCVGTSLKSEVSSGTHVTAHPPYWEGLLNLPDVTGPSRSPFREYCHVIAKTNKRLIDSFEPPAGSG